MIAEPYRTLLGWAAIMAGGVGGALLGAQWLIGWAQIGCVLGAVAGFGVAAVLWWG